MTSRVSSVWSACIAALLVASIPTVCAQAPSDFAGEPDKSMASGYESFLKGDINKAAERIHEAAAYVRTQEDKVAKEGSKSLKKAGDDLDRLGGEVKKGAVKSPDQLKKNFAQVDHALASAWYATVDREQKAGRDATNALVRAGAGLEGAAKWSGTQLDAGAQAAVDALDKAGQGAKLGVEAVGRVIRGIGEGIADVGSRLTR